MSADPHVLLSRSAKRCFPRPTAQLTVSAARCTGRVLIPRQRRIRPQRLGAACRNCTGTPKSPPCRQLPGGVRLNPCVGGLTCTPAEGTSVDTSRSIASIRGTKRNRRTPRHEASDLQNSGRSSATRRSKTSGDLRVEVDRKRRRRADLQTGPPPTPSLVRITVESRSPTGSTRGGRSPRLIASCRPPASSPDLSAT